MEPITIIGGILAAGASGLGVGAGLRLVPVALRAGRDLRQWKETPEAQIEQRIAAQRKSQVSLAKPQGRKRASSIVGLYEDALRLANGSYARVYEFPLQATMLADDPVSDRRCDELGGMLTAGMPPGTIVQFRYAVGPDPGRAIAEHLQARDYYRTYAPACRLHDLKVDFYKALADARAFRHEKASVTVTVPVKQEGDQTSNGLSAFIPAVSSEIKRRGIRNVSGAVSACRSETADDGVVRRIVNQEQEAFDKAERAFRFFELQSPVPLCRLSRNQLTEAVYKGHVLGARSVPVLPAAPGYDIRDYLCGETIEGRGWYVMHGSTPVAIVSMFTPGHPHVVADATRALTAHRDLTFRHTLVAEFIYLDRRKAQKQIDKRIRQVKRTNNKADGRKGMTPEARAALTDLENVRDHITGSREALIQMRFYAIVYGDPARTRAELKDSLKRLDENCDQLVTAMQSIEGVEAAREEPASLHCLYSQTLIGEANSKPTGREITEVAHSLAAFIPTESAWVGSARPVSLFSTASGRLVGLNLWDKSARSKIKSPLVLILGEPGSGKTTTTACIINDSLATVPDLRVCAVDIGGSLAPHARTVGARYLRFSLNDPCTINIWDYPELTEGEMADDEHISLIVLDAMTLAHVKPDDETAADVLTKAVTQVLKNFVKRNGAGKAKCEPRHAHLVAMLESYDYDDDALNARARSLALALGKYIGNQYLDAPTHPDFCIETPYDVYEIDSLDAFPPDVKMTLANRVAARAIRLIGRLKSDGTRTPVLLAFVEVWKIIRYYPDMLRVIQKGARTNRKENGVTILETHTYDDFTGIHDITKTAGVKLIGKQNGDFSRLVADTGLSPRAVEAINAIKNADGVYTQWVLVLGSGNDQMVKMIHCDLSPAELWTFTTNPDEHNARARVAALRPEWMMAEVIGWLAEHYPRGLVSQGLVGIDESLLT